MSNVSLNVHVCKKIVNRKTNAIRKYSWEKTNDKYNEIEQH